jgi:hypothetical protein
MSEQTVEVVSEGPDGDFEERVFQARASGLGPRQVDGRFNLSVQEVKAICRQRLPY